MLKKIIEIREFMIAAIIFLLCVFFTIMEPGFISFANIKAIFLGLSVEAIIAVGMTILLVSGNFDLSVGSILAFVGAATAMALDAGIAAPLAILIGLGVGGMFGFINGYIISKLKINPFITTLGTMIAIRGLVLIVTGGRSISGLPDSFNIIGQTSILGVQLPIIIMLIIVIVGDLLLRRTRFFRQAYYIGANEKAAVLSGINVTRVKIILYIMIGVLTAIAAILMTARFGAASVTAGEGMELRIITAVIIGGASLQGGEGTVFGAALGSLLMGVITNGLNLLGVEVYWQSFVIGATLLTAVIIDHFSQARRESNISQSKSTA